MKFQISNFKIQISGMKSHSQIFEISNFKNQIFSAKAKSIFFP